MNQSEVTKNSKDLIYLISCAVNNVSPDAQRCSQIDDEAVYSLAARHMLSAAAAFALEKVMTLPQHWLNAKGNSKRRLVIYQAERSRLLRELDRRGIWYLPLKGILIKDMYPDASMREMSDNDILCDAEKMSEVREVMESLGFTCVEFGKQQHDVYRKNLMCFEMHTKLFNNIAYPEAYSYFQTVKERLIKDEDNLCGYHMTDNDFYIYCIYHIYKHFSKAGTGLRSLLDIYIINKAKEKTLDRDYIGRVLDILGVREYESETRKLAEKVFSFQPLSDKEAEELSFYVHSGIYGNIETLVLGSLKSNRGKQAKRRYIHKRVFPDDKQLKLYYPAVYRHRALYPFLVAYRPFKGLVTQRKKLFGEVKALWKFRHFDDDVKKS